MITEEKKRREAFKFNVNLSDKDIRQIRATAQGMTTYINTRPSLKRQVLSSNNSETNEVMSLKASYQTERKPLHAAT